MHHVQDGLHFERKENGDVEVTLKDTGPENETPERMNRIVFTTRIPKDAWVSLLVAASGQETDHATHKAFEAIHMMASEKKSGD